MRGFSRRRVESLHCSDLLKLGLYKALEKGALWIESAEEKASSPTHNLHFWD